MHRYDLLEKRYYKKKVLEALLALAAVGSIAAAGYFLLSKPKEEKAVIKDINFTKEIKKEVVTPIIFEKHKEEIEQAKTKEVFLVPEVNFSTKDIEPLISQEVPKRVKFKFDMPNEKAPFSYSLSFKVEIPKKEKSKQKVEVIKKEPKKEPIQTNGLIEEELSEKVLLKKFYNSPSFSNAILIAEYYYSHGNLEKAKDWALKANSIDSADYQSWEMFAKILLAKGDKEQAKKVLKAYIKNYGYNENIENLLRSIE